MPQSSEAWNFTNEVRVANGNLKPDRLRSELAQEPLTSYPIPWTSWRIYDALQTNLPGVSSGDDLALIGGTFGTSSPSLQTYDVKAAGSLSLYARCQFPIPPEYDLGETILLRFHAGMLTTIADVACTLDAEAYKSNSEAGIGSDLVTTAALNINSLTLADKDFNIDPTTIELGNVLDLRIKIAVNDAASLTAVKGIIGAASLLLDIRG